MIIKVCGMRESENIQVVDKLGVDMIGFIFYPQSSRYITKLPEVMPCTAKRVGVFVNENIETILDIAHRFALDYIQLHGDESVDFCKQLQDKGYQIIKAFQLSSVMDIEQCKDYESVCQYFLFDTPTAKFGGSGQHFEWNLLYQYIGNIPFLLSGGLGVKDVEILKNFHHPQLAGYDLNSRFEISPAIKDTQLLKQFITQMKY